MTGAVHWLDCTSTFIPGHEIWEGLPNMLAEGRQGTTLVDNPAAASLLAPKILQARDAYRTCLAVVSTIQFDPNLPERSWGSFTIAALIRVPMSDDPPRAVRLHRTLFCKMLETRAGASAWLPLYPVFMPVA